MRLLFLTSIIIAVAGVVTLPFLIDPPQLWWPECGAVLLVILLAVLQVKVIRPISAVKTGVSLLDEQDFSCRLANVGQRDADSIAATFNRMIDTLKDERLRVMEQNHFLEMLIDASPAGILILNYDGTIRTANPAVCAMLDYNNPEGKRPSEFKSGLANAISGLKNGDAVTVRLSDTSIYRCLRRTFIDRGFQRPFIMVESLSDEIMRAERSAYGKVIRLIGHEVNNTVAGLTPMFETVDMVVNDPDLREASASCRERCASLSRFITRYAEVVKLPPPARRPADLATLMKSLLPFMESMTAGRDIKITLRADGQAIARFDTVQMEQVVVNVVKNAIESIGDCGLVDISVTSTPVGFTVTDNGAGISAEASENMFSPFFSTKEGGQGIGLTLVSEILRNHDATFRLHTSPTDGLTRFEVKFQ